MILSDLLGSRVYGGDFLGYVSDARFLLDEQNFDQPTPTARLYGLVISPHARSSSLGFERSEVKSPWPIAAVVRWRHRGSFLVRWNDVEQLSDGRVDLRSGYRRFSSMLSGSAAVRPD